MFKKREICVVFALAVILAGVAAIYHDNVPNKFDTMSDQDKASYCMGVFGYGKSFSANQEQKYSFTKATEWFEQRAEKFGGVKNTLVNRAKTDLEAMRVAGNQSGFEKTGSLCADVVLANKK